MAFLCPVRIRRSKKKGEIPPPPNFFSSNNSPAGVSPSPPGRITGSSSIETLVRVGIEKAESGSGPSARFQVLHDFEPCVDDELYVKKGDVVSLLYREHDWAYVLIDRPPPNEGFIPYSYVIPLKDTESIDSPLPNSIPTPFCKTPSESQYLCLYTFTARDENDLNLERGQIVTLLNEDDPEWAYCLVKSTNEEGFVPSAFLKQINQSDTTTSTNSQAEPPQDHPEKNTNEKPGGSSNSKGVELIMLYDYKAQSADDVSVKRGDWVHANLSVQTVQGWLWVYAPKSKKYGFIPRAYARLPAMTSL